MKRTELLSKLKVVGQALAETNLIPIYQCFCLNGKTVSAYNDTIGIVAPCVTQDAFAVNGKVLLGLLENSTAEDVNFVLSNNDVVLTLGKNTSTLPYFPKADFLFTEPEVSVGAWMPLDDDLRRGLQACLLTSSKDLAQPAFMGVYLNQQFDLRTLYSSDGDAITSYITDQKAEGAEAMIPNGFCEIVLKLEASKDDVLDANEEWVAASLGPYKVYGRLIQLDNPVDHNAEIKKTINGKAKFIKVPEGLTDALSRARVVADLESKPTVISIDGPHFHLVTESGYGVVDDMLKAEAQPMVTATVSAELMQRCLGLCDEMTIQANCCAFRNGKKLFILTSNMGD